MFFYDILDLLREAGFNSQPPVAYRALDFLVENGFAHKIERLNAFVACALPGTVHSPAFMICRQCDIVAETQSSSSDFDLSANADASGFKIEQTIVEAKRVVSVLRRNRKLMKLVSVENLSVSYGANTVLRAVDLEIELGEIVTVVGPNGSGKTSLLKAIIGGQAACQGLGETQTSIENWICSSAP